MNAHFWGKKQPETPTNEHLGIKKREKQGVILMKKRPHFSSKRQKMSCAHFFLFKFGLGLPVRSSCRGHRFGFETHFAKLSVYFQHDNSKRCV